MLNWMIPFVIFCVFTPGENNTCNEQTAVWKHSLPPANTPMSCLMDGWSDAAQSISKFQEDHPNKDFEFRVICKHEKV